MIYVCTILRIHKVFIVWNLSLFYEQSLSFFVGRGCSLKFNSLNIDSSSKRHDLSQTKPDHITDLHGLFWGDGIKSDPNSCCAEHEIECMYLNYLLAVGTLAVFATIYCNSSYSLAYILGFVLHEIQPNCCSTSPSQCEVWQAVKQTNILFIRYPVATEMYMHVIIV